MMVRSKKNINGRIVVKEPVVDKPGTCVLCKHRDVTELVDGKAYSLWNTNAEEVEIANPRELEDELLGQKVPHSVAGSPHVV
jgi:hypothetical protein